MNKKNKWKMGLLRPSQGHQTPDTSKAVFPYFWEKQELRLNSFDNYGYWSEINANNLNVKKTVKQEEGKERKKYHPCFPPFLAHIKDAVES